jgi:hypothetical protein
MMLGNGGLLGTGDTLISGPSEAGGDTSTLNRILYLTHAPQNRRAQALIPDGRRCTRRLFRSCLPRRSSATLRSGIPMTVCAPALTEPARKHRGGPGTGTGRQERDAERGEGGYRLRALRKCGGTFVHAFDEMAQAKNPSGPDVPSPARRCAAPKTASTIAPVSRDARRAALDRRLLHH